MAGRRSRTTARRVRHGKADRADKLYSDAYRNKRIISAKATSRAQLAGNPDAAMPLVGTDDPTEDQVFIMPMTIYDKLGNDYKINVRFWKVKADDSTSTWQWK